MNEEIKPWVGMTQAVLRVVLVVLVVALALLWWWELRKSPPRMGR